MLLAQLLCLINEEVKANPKILSFEVRLSQYPDIDADDNGTASASHIAVRPKICRGECSTVVIG
jgi:hypothetical protein